MIDPDQTYSARAAAAELGIDERTIRRAIRVGEIPATRSGRWFVMAGGDLLAWSATRLASRSTSAGAADGEIDDDGASSRRAGTRTPNDPETAVYQRLYLAERDRAEALAQEVAVWRERATVADSRAQAVEAQLAALAGVTGPAPLLASAATTPTPPSSTPAATTTSPASAGLFARLRRRGP